MAVKDVCRKNGISSPTYCKWKAQYGGLDASKLKRMKELESEVSQYKRMYAELAHENYALKELIEKNEAVPNSVGSRWRFKLNPILCHLFFAVHCDLIAELCLEHP